MPRRPPGAVVNHDNGIHLPGIYERVLREACRQQVIEESGLMSDWLTASETAEAIAQWESEVTVLSDLLFNERVGLGEPVIAWWYWLPQNLPPPLDDLGKTGDGPRHLLVTPDDFVTPEPTMNRRKEIRR
jgi:hypothetical protein